MEYSKKKTNQRWYLLRTGNQFSENLSLSLFGGLSLAEKSFSTIETEFIKALRADYTKILLPWNALYHSEAQKIIHLIKKNPSSWALQVQDQSFKDYNAILKSLTSLKDFTIDFAIDNENLEVLQLLNARGSFQTDWQISILAHNKFSLKKVIALLDKKYHDKIHIHFPYSHKNHPYLYKTSEMYEFLKEQYFPPVPIDIYNLSTPKHLKLEPDIHPDFFYKSQHPDVLISVIIPAYNSKNTLQFTLQHLYKQDLKKDHWEVIIIDDGSFDKTNSLLQQIDSLKNLNFKYIYFPRDKKRNMMDFTFRAGIARNLGVKHSAGQYLAFLDSDILIPSNYLSSICKEFQNYDVIQHPRFHLTKQSPNEYESIKQNLHCFIKGNAYWENFYSSNQDWNKRRLPWKYISTNTLCIKKDIFKKIGWFKKNYTCYGFEDTDLGWRLYQEGYKFKLNKINTYHCYRSSEFFNFNLIKSYLLSRSASIFFHNTHSLESYEEFKHLIEKTYWKDSLKNLLRI